MGFRLGAAGLGVLVVLLVEGALRIAGWGKPQYGADAFVAFREIRRLFDLDAAGKAFVTAAARTNFFVRDRFSAVKGEGAFRVFVLGGSTVQGRPYAIETAFPRWAQLGLQAREPGRAFEFVNCGGISYASYRLTPILQECLKRYEPDAVILCTGQNEFLEARTYTFRAAPVWIRRVCQQLASWHLCRLFGRAWQRLGGGQTGFDSAAPRPILPSEVEALLDSRGGLSAYRRDEALRSGVAEHFKHNLRRMAGMCRAASVPLMVLSPPVNLRSCPPFKSEHRKDLTAEELALWQTYSRQAREWYAAAPEKAAAYLRRVIELDAQYAHTHFALGTLLEQMGRRKEARRAFLRAKELDVCPLRMLESERQSLAETARQFGLPFIDLQTLLEAESDFDSLGSDLLVDHVHPTIAGHQRIAEAVVETILAEGWLRTPAPAKPAEWAERRRKLFQANMESLPPQYFVHGQMRLENLRLWTEGRAEGLPPAAPESNRQEQLR